jgi:hypothetical protein
MPIKSRYPGTRPFTDKEGLIFFGRTADIADIGKRVLLNRITVLYSESGVGKSSLIEAGLKSGLEAGYHIISFRFEAKKDDSESLMDKFRNVLKKEVEQDPLFLSETTTRDRRNESAWRYLKTLQWRLNGHENPEVNKKKKGIILVFDQFEEIGSYIRESAALFARDFSEVIYNRAPHNFQQEIYERISEDEQFVTRKQEELRFMEQETPVYILIAIRQDRLSVLDLISEYVPEIYSSRHPLMPLSTDQIREAIVKPSDIRNESLPEADRFGTEHFSWSEGFLTRILDHLFYKRRADAEAKFEAFQLQLICSAVERKLMAEEKPAGFVVNEDFIGSIDQVIENFYENDVLTIEMNEGAGAGPDKNLGLLIRYLIERKLIDDKSETRISLDKGLLGRSGLSEKVLSKLLETRIIRREPNSASGESLEVSHDSLLKPILSSAIKLGNLENLLYRNLIVVEGFSSKKALRRLLNWDLLKEEKGNFYIDVSNDPGSKDSDYILALKKKRILWEAAGEKRYYFAEAYTGSIDRIKEEMQVKIGRSYRKNLLIGSAMVLLLLSGLILLIHSLTMSGNKAYAAIAISNIDSLKDKELALMTLRRAKKVLQNGSATDDLVIKQTATCDRKIVDLFEVSDLDANQVIKDSMSIFSKTTYDRDSLILITYNALPEGLPGNTSPGFPFQNSVMAQYKSVLYRYDNSILRSWPSWVYHIGNSNVDAVFTRDSILFFEKGKQSGRWKNIFYKESGAYTGPQNIEIKLSSRDGLLLKNDSAIYLYYKGRQTRDFAIHSRNNITLNAFFLDNGNVITVKSVAAYTRFPSTFRTLSNFSTFMFKPPSISAQFLTADGRTILPQWTKGQRLLLSPSGKEVLFKNNDGWVILDENNQRRLSSPISSYAPLIDGQDNVLFQVESMVVLFNSAKDSLEQEVSGYGNEIIDFRKHCWLVLKSSYDQAPSSGKLRQDSLFIVDRSTKHTDTLTFRSGSTIDARFAGSGDTVLLSETNEIEHRKYLGIYDRKQKKMIVRLSLSNNDQYYYHCLWHGSPIPSAIQLYGSSPIRSFSGESFFGSPTSANTIRKIKIYDLQQPVLKISDNADSVLGWMDHNASMQRRGQDSIDNNNHFLKPWIVF